MVGQGNNPAGNRNALMRRSLGPAHADDHCIRIRDCDFHESRLPAWRLEPHRRRRPVEPTASSYSRHGDGGMPGMGHRWPSQTAGTATKCRRERANMTCHCIYYRSGMPNCYPASGCALIPSGERFSQPARHAGRPGQKRRRASSYRRETTWAYAECLVSRFTIWRSRNTGVINAGTEQN